MGKLIVIMGKSSVGKDTLLNLMEERGYKRVVSHTSRPKRSTEVDGKEYHFISDKKIIKMIDNDEFVEVRNYQVANGDIWYYGIHKDTIDLCSDDIYVCIVDANGIKELKAYYGEDNIIGIYLYVSNRERLIRALNRCKVDDNDVDEIVRRYQADNKDFTKDAIRECIFRINNIDINDTLNIVMRNIRVNNKRRDKDGK